jgi:hypothetical protein
VSRIAAKDPAVMPANFSAIVAAAQFSHQEAPATTDLDALDEIRNHLNWIETNIEEGDTDAVKIENLAQAAAAIFRYGELLASKLRPQEMRKIREGLLS